MPSASCERPGVVGVAPTARGALLIAGQPRVTFKAEPRLRVEALIEALAVLPLVLRRLAERGAVERVGRGLYRHPEAPLTEHHSLALVSKRYPEARGCLLSALQFHEMTTQ